MGGFANNSLANAKSFCGLEYEMLEIYPKYPAQVSSNFGQTIKSAS